MILSKYGSSHSSNLLGLWSAIPSLNNLGTSSIQYIPSSNSKVWFSTGVWYQHYSMTTRYLYLFEICSNQDISLQQVINS
jgi:hypothetical protein